MTTALLEGGGVDPSRMVDDHTEGDGLYHRGKQAAV